VPGGNRDAVDRLDDERARAAKDHDGVEQVITMAWRAQTKCSVRRGTPCSARSKTRT
jgi:hypothetical protein